MIKKETYAPFLPGELAAQIEDICNCLHDIKKEASDIAMSDAMPDASVQLNDVLQSTENATISILDEVDAMKGAVSPFLSAEANVRLEEQVAKIYELCNFQDITGQRIKKVLNSLNEVETKLLRLAKAVGVSANAGEASVPKTAEVSLMNGPQLSGAAPSQADVDRMFSALGGST